VVFDVLIHRPLHFMAVLVVLFLLIHKAGAHAGGNGARHTTADQARAQRDCARQPHSFKRLRVCHLVIPDGVEYVGYN